jgi:hypothetical protein
MAIRSRSRPQLERRFNVASQVRRRADQHLNVKHANMTVDDRRSIGRAA